MVDTLKYSVLVPAAEILVIAYTTDHPDLSPVGECSLYLIA
jgi:hypothetical protein